MTHALAILIASSVGCSSPEGQPTRAEIDVITSSVDTVVHRAPAIDVVIPAPTHAAPVPPTMPSIAPVLNDVRAIILYDLALPFFRTKP